MKWCSNIIFITGSFLDIFHFFILSAISPIFPAFPSRKLSIGMNAKGQSFGPSRCFLSSGSCPLWFLRSAGHLQYPYRICFPVGNCTKWYSTWLGPEVIFLLFHIFPLSPIFLSFPPKEVSMGIIRFFLDFGFLQFLGELGGFVPLGVFTSKLF